MPWVTEEEIQAAKNMTAYEYCERIRHSDCKRQGPEMNGS